MRLTVVPPLLDSWNATKMRGFSCSAGSNISSLDSLCPARKGTSQLKDTIHEEVWVSRLDEVGNQ